MTMIDNTAIFIAVAQRGGFSHAAKMLGVSNGLISRRIAQLEAKLGVTLIKRTTRQFQLTPEGELFWQHAERIQLEFDSVIDLIQSRAKKPKGTIRISAPPFFGRHLLTPMLLKFLHKYQDINIDLILDLERLDPIREHLDLIIRGAGYLREIKLQDSSLQMKLLGKEKIGLYASAEFIQKYGEPDTPSSLPNLVTINFLLTRNAPGAEQWAYSDKSKQGYVTVKPKLTCNDMDSALQACIAGFGIGRFTTFNVKQALQGKKLQPVLSQYDWGSYNLYAIFAQQRSLPQRTRLLLQYIQEQMRKLV